MDGFLARWAVRARSEPAAPWHALGVRLGAPDFLAKSELFAGKAHHI